MDARNLEWPQLSRCEKQLQNRWPLVGAWLGRKAARQLAADGSADAVPLLVLASLHADGQVRSIADAALRSTTDRGAVDALCRLAIEEPEGAAATICREAGKRPGDPEEASLLLFVTKQLDAYFKEDFEFQNLRAAYDRANERVRGYVMDVVRSGDRRCLGFFGRRKPLSECSEAEINTAIDSVLKHGDWPRLFRAVLELPPKYGFSLLEHLRKSKWEPENEEQKNLCRALLRESSGEALPPAKPQDATSSVFERWLEQGRTGELAQLGEAELLDRLKNATPPQAVPVVAALASKATPGGEATKVVQGSPHWLVRLAGYATGMCQPTDLAQDGVQDDNRWVRELVHSAAVLELWPARATPADLDALNAAPREAFAGKLGAVRRVLRLLLAYRVTAPEMTEVVFEAGEFAGEFESA